jgi:LacI family transcriptional regulator
MPSPKRTVLIPALEWEPFSQMRLGVLRYARQQVGWRFEPLPNSLPPVFAGLSNWRGDGAILILRNQFHLRLAKKLPFPVVNVSAFLPAHDVPRVRPNDVAVGQMAADHFRCLGLRNLLFVGKSGFFQVAERQEGLCQRAVLHGMKVRLHTIADKCRTWGEWETANRRLEEALQKLPLPFGVLAASDLLAQRVLLACRRVGLEVPGSVAVVGIDNAEPICRYTDPPLTSIDRNMEQVGFEAAALLDRLMTGESPPPTEIIIPPGALIKRQSSDTIGFSDPDVRTVITYMRAHLHEVFGVERLMPLVTVSRRGLERHFFSQVGTTLHDYLSALRIERGKQLLSNDVTLSVKEIATSCGFSNSRRFALVFRRVTGGTWQMFRASQLKNLGSPIPTIK